MKTLKPTLTVFFYFIFVALIAQQNGATYSVIRGERPPVDLNALTEDAYEAGVLLVKFKEEHGKHLEENSIGKDHNGNISFGIEQVDVLCKQFSVKNAKQLFSAIATKTGFSQKHKAWGFHLWYKVHLDENADIVALANEFRKLPEIETAEPEYKKIPVWKTENQSGNPDKDKTTPKSKWTPNDPLFDQQWHYHNTGQNGGQPGADIDLLNAWDIEKGNPNVIVAVIDDGIDFNHPDLAANMWSGTGYNFVDNMTTVIPGFHGTHVAGTVAAVNNNGIGVAGIAGGSGNGDGVRLMSCQVFRELSDGQYLAGGFEDALIYAADQGVAIAQNSWNHSTPFVFNQSILDAIDYFNMYGGSGITTGGGLTIFAAGNEAGSAHYYPAYYSGTIAVAASDNNDVKTEYSNYGNWIDISAPGDGILSTTTNNQYGFMSGTSMACPAVSGLAALIISKAFGLVSPEQVKDIIVSTADDHYYQNPFLLGKLGSGRINASNALLETAESLLGVFNPSGFTAKAIGSNAINLSWTKNLQENDILLVMFDNDNFGTPNDGVNYIAGDSLPGGGIVLIQGNETQFLLLNLEASTEYQFGIWSTNNNFEYSSGRYTSEISQGCDTSNQCTYTFRLSSRYGGNWGKQYVTILQGGREIANLYKGCGNSFFDEYVNLCDSLPFYLQYHWELPEGHNNTFDIVAMKIIDPNGQLIYNKPHGILTSDTLINAGIGNCSAASCPIPKMPEVMMISTNAVQIGWTPGGNETLWQIEYGPRGFIPGNGILLTDITNNPYLLEGLEQGTRYDLYIYAICNETEISFQSLVLAFSTDCGFYTLPYYNDFDNENIMELPTCWQSNGSGGWQVNILDQYAVLSEPNSIRLLHQKDNYAILISPLFDFGMNDIRIRFHAIWAWLPSTLKIGFMSDPSDVTSFVEATSINNINTNYRYEWEEFNIMMDNPGEGYNYVAIKLGENQPDTISWIMSWIDIDNLFIEIVEECPEPYHGIVIDQISETSVRLSWEQKGEVDQWEVAFGPIGCPLGSEGFIFQNVHENPFVLEGLNPASWYQFFIRSKCLSQVSPWVFGGSISTLSYPLPLPHQEDLSTASIPYLPGGWHAIGQGVFEVGLNIYRKALINLTYPGPFGILIAPNFDTEIAEISVSFMALSWSSTLVVGVITDISDFQTFQAVEQIEMPLEPGQPITYTIDFESYNGPEGRIAFKYGPNDGKPIIMYDFSFENNSSYIITANAGEGGNIDPEGLVSLNYGQNQTFTITPNTGYEIADVLVDGVSVGALSTYTFENVSANHTIEASFSMLTYTINASADANGSISPSGDVNVNFGQNQTFTITPDTGYEIADVLIDGVSVGALSTYTFENVTANHTIAASFSMLTYTINASAGANGSISPSGNVNVNYGQNQTFTITPDTGYEIADVLIDGVSVGALSTYTFENVTANHTIEASFSILMYTINASSGIGGSISPEGNISVPYGGSQQFTFNPDENYVISSVWINGDNLGFMENYTFVSVNANHNIHVDFELSIGLSDTPDNSLIVELYPNPAHDQITIKVQDNAAIKQNLSYKLFNLTGIILTEGFIKGNTQILNVSTLPVGVYPIIIYQNQIPAKVMKVVIH